MAVTLAVTATAAAAIVIRRSPSVGLSSEGGYTGSTADRAQIGRQVNVGFGAGIEAIGDSPVHIESVEVLGLPNGLRLRSVFAEELRPGGQGTVGVLEGDLTIGPEARDLRPVTEAVFIPGQPSRWYFVVVVVPEKVGIFQTQGFRVNWRAGKHRGHEDYRDYFRVTVPA